MTVRLSVLDTSPIVQGIQRASDRAEIAVRSGGVLVGLPDTVRGLLQAVLDETGTTELMLTTPVYGHAARRRSYELVGTIAPLLQ